MRFSIEPAVLAKFPGACLGLAHCSGIDNTKPSPALAGLLRDAEASVRQRLTLETLTSHPHIACWREAYRAFGAKPSDYRSSIEALCRRVLRGDALPSISPLVDAYNVVSLKHLLPVGGEDLAKVSGDVSLRFAGADEPAVQVLGQSAAEPPVPGEVIYADAIGTLCRRWNWREAARTQLSASTRECVLVIEGLAPAVPEQAVAAALSELAELVQRFCGGALRTALLSAAVPSLEL